MTIFIIGDSHTVALQRGANLLKRQDEFPEGYPVEVRTLGNGLTLTKPFFIDKGDYAEITRPGERLPIKRLPFADDDKHVDYYAICAPLHASRLWRNPFYWTRYTPFADQSGHAPISTGLLRQVVFQQEQYMMDFIGLLKRVGVKVFVVEAPKPYRHHSIFKLVAPEVILYVDGFYRKTMRAWLASKDVPIVNVPAACYDADGFMYEHYQHHNPADGYHANWEFGAVMIQEIVNFVKTQNNPD